MEQSSAKSQHSNIREASREQAEPSQQQENLPVSRMGKAFADGRLNGAQRQAYVQQLGRQRGNQAVLRLLASQGLIQRNPPRSGTNSTSSTSPVSTSAPATGSPAASSDSSAASSGSPGVGQIFSGRFPQPLHISLGNFARQFRVMGASPGQMPGAGNAGQGNHANINAASLFRPLPPGTPDPATLGGRPPHSGGHSPTGSHSNPFASGNHHPEPSASGGTSQVTPSVTGDAGVGYDDGRFHPVVETQVTLTDDWTLYTQGRSLGRGERGWHLHLIDQPAGALVVTLNPIAENLANSLRISHQMVVNALTLAYMRERQRILEIIFPQVGLTMDSSGNVQALGQLGVAWHPFIRSPFNRITVSANVSGNLDLRRLIFSPGTFTLNFQLDLERQPEENSRSHRNDNE